MNNALKICPSEIYLKNFKRRCLQNSCVIASIFIFTANAQYFGALKTSIATFFINFVFIYPDIMLFAFASYVKAAESFITAIMEEFKDDVIKIAKMKGKNVSRHCEKLSMKYKEIYDLSNQFNDTFGLTITGFITLGSSLTVFNVISDKKL